MATHLSNPDSNRRRLEQFIEIEGVTLRRTLRHYVLRAGINDGGDVQEAVDDLFNDVMIEAFAHVERLSPEIQPRAWLLGIAANLIKREQAARTKRDTREPLIRDLYYQQQEMLSDDELFELLPSLEEAASTELEMKEILQELLYGLTKKDADILRLAILEEFDGDALAAELGISTNAARVRMHRALNRLRQIHSQRDRR